MFGTVIATRGMSPTLRCCVQTNRSRANGERTSEESEFPRSPSTHWRACLPSPYPITIDVMTECIGKSLDVPTSSVAVAYCRLGRRTLAQDDTVQREEGHRPSVRPLKTMPLPICPRHCYRSVPFREASLLGELRQLLQAINRDEARSGPIMAGTAPRMPAIGGCFLSLSMSAFIYSYPIRGV